MPVSALKKKELEEYIDTLEVRHEQFNTRLDSLESKVEKLDESVDKVANICEKMSCSVDKSESSLTLIKIATLGILFVSIVFLVSHLV